MPTVTITQEVFREDRQGRTFTDLMNDPQTPFQEMLEFFNDEGRQRRMMESEIHHDRAPLAGVVREFEAQPSINRFLAGIHSDSTKRFRQAVGVLVRIIMEQRGWRKTGRKGSLGVRAAAAHQTPVHNTGGLAFWFIRAERYERGEGMPYRSVREQWQELNSSQLQETATEQKGRSRARGKNNKRDRRPAMERSRRQQS